MSIFSESIDGSCTCRPSPLPQYTGRQGWRQSLPQVPFLSISPTARPRLRNSEARPGVLTVAANDGSHREITAARVYFFFFFYLCFRYGFDSSVLVRGRPAESSTSCLCYSEWPEPTASLETRCAATSVFKTGNIRRNSALEGSGRADVRKWDYFKKIKIKQNASNLSKCLTVPCFLFSVES